MKLQGPWRITFDTNPDDCNMSCIMCERFSRYSEPINEIPRRMPYNLVETIVAEAKPLGLKEIIPSTMGEPLLYRDFEKILVLCKKHNIHLNLTTNGTWPRKPVEEWAKLLCPVTSDIKVSWNGVTKETQESIMQGSQYEKRLHDLISFLKIRNRITQSCTVTLQCTFMEINQHEIPDLVKLAISMGVDRVKGHHLWVNFPELEEENLLRDQRSRSLWNETVKKCIKIKEESASIIKLDNFFLLPEGPDNSLSHEWICPFLGKELWINTEGRVDPCCAPDSERMSLGTLGYVKGSGDLEQIWNSDRYNRLISKQETIPLCKKCTLRKPKEMVQR